MAIEVVTNNPFTSSGSISGGTYTSPSFTIPPNTLLIVHLEIGHSVGSSNATVHGVSGMGLTWTTLFPCLKDPAGNSGGSAFYAQTGGSSVTGSLTVTFTTGNIANRGVNGDILQITGHDTSAPIRTNNKVQTNGTSTLASITLPQSSLGSADNRVFYYAARPVNNNAVLVASGWTAIYTVNYYSTGDLFQIAWKPSGYTQTAQPNFQTNANWQGFAYEVVAAPSMVPIGPAGDTAGTFTEQQPIVGVLTADSATSTEATASTATAPGAADTAGFTEAAVVYVPVTQADTGYLDESALVSSGLFLTEDTGTATDDLATVSAAATDADTGVAVEQAALGTTLDGADAFAGSDAEDRVILVAAPDLYLTGVDTGAYTDAATLTGDLVAADTAAGTDAATVAALEYHLVADADQATGTDTVTGNTAWIDTDPDTAAAAEAAEVVDVGYLELADTDAALLADAAGLTGYAADSDTATATETTGTIFEIRYPSDADAATGADDQSVFGTRQVADTAASTEAASVLELLRPLSDSDTGRLRDRIAVAQLISPDGQSATIGGDDGGFNETAAVVVIATGGADRAGFTDAGKRTVLTRAPFVIRPVASDRYVDRPVVGTVVRPGVQVANRP